MIVLIEIVTGMAVLTEIQLLEFTVLIEIVTRMAVLTEIQLLE
jgi:hypothetical protein